MNNSSYIKMSELTFMEHFRNKEMYLKQLMDEKIERFIEEKTKPKKSFLGKVTTMSREDAIKTLDEETDDEWIIYGNTREILLCELKLDLERLHMLFNMLMSSEDKRIFLSQRDYEFLTKVG